MTEAIGRRAAHGTAWLGLVNMLSKGSQVLVTLALGSYLSRAELGSVTIAVVLVNLGQTLQSMGVYDVISRTTHEVRAFTGTVATLSLLMAAGASVMLFAAGGPIAELVGAPSAAWPIRITGLSLPFTAYAGVQMAYLHRRLDFRRRLIPDAGSALAGAAVTIGSAALGAGSWSLVAGILTTAVLAPLFGILVGVRIPLRWNRSHRHETVTWIRVVGPAAVLGVLLLNIDYVVVTRSLGEEANGLYSYAYRFAFVPYIMIAVVLSGVAFPVYTRVVERDRLSGAPVPGSLLTAAFTRVLHALLAATAGLYVLLALLAPRIVVIDARWGPSAPVLTVLCGYGLLLGLVLAGYDALRAIGRPEVYLRAQATHVVLLLGLAILMVRRSGIIGVAWAQLIAAALVTGGVAVALARVGVLNAGCARVLRGPAAAAAVTVAVFAGMNGARLLPPDDSLPGLLALGLGLAACYTVTLAAVDRGAVRELRHLAGR
ncbi:MAG: oligosaccharide flippase family protein [Kineosporiaceae bacterium]|jgi:PST family polysaccharide transporter